MTFVIVVPNVSSWNKNVRLNVKRNNGRRVWISHAVSKLSKTKVEQLSVSTEVWLHLGGLLSTQ